MIRYDKLVRDGIPAIIAADGKKYSTRVLGEEEYVVELRRKLQEEVAEFLDEPSVGELADILELVGALSETLGASLPEVEAARMEKREARGGFAKRIFLESVE